MSDSPASDELQCPTCGESFPNTYAVCPKDASPLEAASGDRLIGSILAGTYRIVRVLGEGGMARIYEAEHLRIEARFAVKVIHEELAKTPELIARFRREAKAAARVHSPHIVAVVDVLQTADARPCIITELLSGEDLQQRLDRVGKFAVDEAIPIATQMCLALAAAHRSGVVHRDLKPSNVFLGEEDGATFIKVLDFGVAKLDDKAELTKSGAIVGTLSYMAPEQAKRAADAGPLADVYQVGAVLYHMLTGEPPYGADPPVNPLVLLLGGPPKAPRKLEPTIAIGVEAVIQRAMARDAKERPTAAELFEQLSAFGPSEQRTSAGVGEPATEAEEISRDARIARPLALMVTAALVIAAALYAAAMLGVLIDDSRTGAERGLIVLVAVAVGAVVGTMSGRSLARRWRDLPAVERMTRTLARPLAVGILAFGSLELLSLGVAASAANYGDFADGWGFRLIASGALSAVAALWPILRFKKSRLSRL